MITPRPTDEIINPSRASIVPLTKEAIQGPSDLVSCTCAILVILLDLGRLSRLRGFCLPILHGPCTLAVQYRTSFWPVGICEGPLAVEVAENSAATPATEVFDIALREAVGQRPSDICATCFA